MDDFDQPRNALFRCSHTAHRLQPWMVAPAGRNSLPELSDSLLNTPRRVNSSVRFGTTNESALPVGIKQNRRLTKANRLS